MMKGIKSNITITTEIVSGSMTTTMRDDGVEIGQVILSDCDSLIPEIVGFEVLESHRKRGFGYKLLEEVISQYQKRNKEIIALKVIPNECRSVEQEVVEMIYTKLSHKLFKKYGIPIYQYTMENSWRYGKYQILKIRDTDYYIISGSLLKGVPKGVNDKHFWEMHKYSHDDFYNLLLCGKQYFDDLINNKTTIDDKSYYIYAPQEYLDLGLAKRVVVIRNNCEAVNARYIFAEHPVVVTKKGDGYYYAGDDGRHSFMIAQEFGLDLLVKIKD